MWRGVPTAGGLISTSIPARACVCVCMNCIPSDKASWRGTGRMRESSPIHSTRALQTDRRRRVNNKQRSACITFRLKTHETAASRQRIHGNPPRRSNASTPRRRGRARTLRYTRDAFRCASEGSTRWRGGGGGKRRLPIITGSVDPPNGFLFSFVIIFLFLPTHAHTHVYI